MHNCNRFFSGVKFVSSNGDKKYISNDEIKNLDPYEFSDHVNELQKKYPDINLDNIVKRIMIITGYFNVKYDQKIVPGNILQITEIRDENDITEETVKEIKIALHDLSDKNIRKIYNQVYPDVGDKIYEMLYNYSISSTSRETNYKSNIDDYVQPSQEMLLSLNQEKLMNVINFYAEMIQMFMNLPKENNLINFCNNMLNEVYDFEKLNNCNAYNFAKFANDNFVKFMNDDKDEYKMIFETLIPGGKVLFDVFEQLMDNSIATNYDNQDLAKLLGF